MILLFIISGIIIIYYFMNKTQENMIMDELQNNLNQYILYNPEYYNKLQLNMAKIHTPIHRRHHK